MPHLHWEERVLYPEVDQRSGTPWATRSERLEHQQLQDLIARVDAEERRRFETGVIGDGLQPLLFGLEALLRAHMEREERLLIPELEEQEGAMHSGRGWLVTA